MINDVIVIDDVVSRNYQDAIEAKILDRNFPWYYVPNISRQTEGEDQLSTDSIGFAHNFIDIDKGSMSFVTDFLLPLLYGCCARVDVMPKEVFWGRVFMTIASGHSNRNLFHTDMNRPHLVCLYYVNDANGPTVILNKTHEDIDRNEVNDQDQSDHIRQEVNPKKGRVVIFDGKFYHASTSPETGRRCIINFDVGN